MDPQQYYDVAYSVKLAGRTEEDEIVRCYFIRSGRRETTANIMKIYGEIAREARHYGYSDPMGFIADYFSGLYSTDIPLYRRKIEQDQLEALVNREAETNTIIKVGGSKDDRGKKQSSVENKKAKKNQSETPKLKKPEFKIARPGKIQGIGEPLSSPIEVPTDAKIKIAKSKRSLPYYKELSAKERDLDNRFDYFVMHSQSNGSGKIFYDSRGVLDDNPTMGEMMGDFDIEFRKIMTSIYNRVKHQNKDKSRKQEDLEILQEYFERKLSISKEEDNSGKRLASAVAYLMKKLQIKLFETNDPAIIRALLFFKTQLYLFYSYYRR